VILAVLYLLLAAWGAYSTAVAVSRGRRPPRRGPLYFVIAFPVAELPLHHILLSAVVTALFAWWGAFEYWPGWLGLVLVATTWGLLLHLYLRSLGSQSAIDRGLQEGLGDHFFDQIRPEFATTLRAGAPPSRWLRPFHVHDRQHVEHIRDLSYGPAGRRNRLDVYRPRQAAHGCPVLLQIHGGAWVFGRKDNQGVPLMNEMARQGWICVAPNYRLSPRATFPEHLIDCKLAIRWIRENIADFGGDPGFIAVTGGSAGGHLAALVALTANDPQYQPGFEDVDTSVVAAVPFYGVFDFLEHNGVDVTRVSGKSFLETRVMKSCPRREREEWERASPIRWVHAEAPPFFILHGSHDSLVWPEGGRRFVEALRKVSRQNVAYAELQGAQHAFDLFNSVRCLNAVNGVATFLAWVRSTRALGTPGASAG
jgi:acetyl esterase/lipase